MRDRVITPSEAAAEEQRERIIQQNAVWLGGIFEIGGTISLTTHKNNGKDKPSTFVQTQISLNDDNLDGLEKLKAIVGGNVYAATQDSWQWRIQGKKAYPIIQAIKPYVPSRQETIAGIELLQEADMSQRGEIAAELRGLNRFSLVVPDDYADLCEDPVFLAGLLDSRGTIKQRLKGRSLETELRVQSQNTALLEACQELLGGTLAIIEAGQIRMTRGQEYTVNRPDGVWKIYGSNAARILERVEPLSILRQELISTSLAAFKAHYT